MINKQLRNSGDTLCSQILIFICLLWSQSMKTTYLTNYTYVGNLVKWYLNGCHGLQIY